MEEYEKFERATIEREALIKTLLSELEATRLRIEKAEREDEREMWEEEYADLERQIGILEKEANKQ